MFAYFCPAAEKRKKRLAFFQSSSVAVNPESSSYYPPVLKKEMVADVHSKNRLNSPPQLSKETPASLLSSPDSGPFSSPPAKRAKPLSYSDESPSSSQTSTDKPAAVDFKALEERVQFLTEAFPEIPKQVTD